MTTRPKLLASAFALSLAAATGATAQTPVRLYSFIIAPDTATPAAGVESRTLTGQTISGATGNNASAFSADIVAISGGINPGNELSFQSGSGFFRIDQLDRNGSADNAGVLIYDLNLNDTAAYGNLTLDLAVTQSTGNGTGSNVYVSYNDAEAGLSIDTSLNSGFTFSGTAVVNQLADASEYTPIAVGLNNTSANQSIADFSLDAIRAASDDGLLRIAISADGFRRGISIRNVAGAESQITGTLIPEPGSISLLLAGGVALLARRRGA